jgi:hypothetical protein
MDLKKTNALLESVKNELKVEAAPADPEFARTAAMLITKGRAKPRRMGASQVEQYLLQHPDASIEIQGHAGQGSLTFTPAERGKIGGMGFNPQNWTPHDIRAAMREMEDCLSTAEQVWNGLKQ